MKTKEKGITLIALVITIIVLVIIAGVSIQSITSNGITEKAVYSKQVQEFSNVRESVRLATLGDNIDNIVNNTTKNAKRNITLEEYNNLPESLKYEILYARDNCPGDKKPTANCYSVYELEEDINDLYFIDNVANIEENSYIYDAKIDSYYKVEPIVKNNVEIFGEKLLQTSDKNKEMLKEIREERKSNNPDVKIELVQGNDNSKIIRVKATEKVDGIASITVSDGQTQTYSNTKEAVIKEFQVSNTGTYQVVVETANSTTTKTVIVNEVIPIEPTILPTEGVAGINDWYTSNVKIKIASENADLKLTYQMTGKKKIAETEIENEKEILLTENGIYTISAYTYDISNQRSVKAERIIKIDKDEPVNITLASNNISDRTPTGFNVNIETTDNFSGINNYEYYINDVKYTDKEITNLANYTEYSVYAKAYDKAGNATTTNTITVKTRCPGNVELTCPGATVETRQCSGSSGTTNCGCSFGGYPCNHCGHSHSTQNSCGQQSIPCSHGQTRAHTYNVTVNCKHGNSASHKYWENCPHNSGVEHD